jgi:uncharacterized protein YggE
MEAMMKRALVLYLLAATLSTNVASAQTVFNIPAGTRTITTQGDADVKVVPDKATVVFQVQTFDKVLQHAYDVNEAGTKAVIALAPKYNVTPANVQTSQISVQPQYGDGGSYGGPVRPPVGYLVETSVALCLSNPAQVPALIRDALAAGANTVQNVTLETTKERASRDEARVMALKAAREKAQSLATEAQSKIGKAIRIEETPSTQFPIAYASNALATRSESADDGGSSLALGQITVHARVTATYELVE